MLKTATDDGEISGQVGISYKPDPSDPNTCIGFAAQVTLRMPGVVSTRITIDVTLESLRGDLLLLIKKPPSNRLWYGFTSEPEMKLKLVPRIETTKVGMQRLLDWLDGAIKGFVSLRDKPESAFQESKYDSWY